MHRFNLTKSAYSINELLAILPIGRTKLHSEINKGRLVAHKLGKRTVFQAQDIANYLQNLSPKIAKLAAKAADESVYTEESPSI